VKLIVKLVRRRGRRRHLTNGKPLTAAHQSPRNSSVGYAPDEFPGRRIGDLSRVGNGWVGEASRNQFRGGMLGVPNPPIESLFPSRGFSGLFPHQGTCEGRMIFVL
jgi:hypothetical protein